MASRDYPINFTPRGLSDAYDATDTFRGACKTLQNLIFDQQNPEIVVARPGVGSPLIDFSTHFTTPTAITVHITIGNTIYGMVSTALTPGFDQPFAFLIGTGFVSISGITGVNVPTSPSSTGDWNPPTMAVVGTKIIVTHPGFSGANYFGVIDITTPATPVWSAGNTATHTLPSVPTSVTNYNNRAYYSCGNTLYYSDVLVPTTMTNAGQSLTIGDTTPITALSGLPIATTSSGVVSALIVFKQFQIWQITGDAAITGSLSQNFLSLTVGCLSPRSVVQTPIGTIFAGVDGPYSILFTGSVIPLTKDSSSLVPDIQSPFQNIINPSRASASFSGTLYRICMNTTIDGQSSASDYWFDITRRRWTGPHTFPYDCASQVGNQFVISYMLNGAKLFLSSYLPSTSSTYMDNGVPITIILKSSSFPKTPNINVKQIIESTIELSSIAVNLTYTINAFGQLNNLIDDTNINVSNSSTIWGGGKLWGSGILWSNSSNIPYTYTIPWTIPIVFKKISLQIMAQSSSNLSIGAFFAKYQDTGYTNL